MIKQYRSPLVVGDAVRVTGPEYHGQIGELMVIDPHAEDEGEFYRVYLDSIGHEACFRADEIVKVEPEDERRLIIEPSNEELPF